MEGIVKKLKQNKPKKYSWGISYPVDTAEETGGHYNSFYKIIKRPVEALEYHKKVVKIT